MVSGRVSIIPVLLARVELHRKSRLEVGAQKSEAAATLPEGPPHGLHDEADAVRPIAVIRAEVEDECRSSDWLRSTEPAYQVTPPF